MTLEFDPDEFLHDVSIDSSGFPPPTASPRLCYEDLRLSPYQNASIDLVWKGIQVSVSVSKTSGKKTVSCRRWYHDENMSLLWSGDDCDWEEFCAHIAEPLRLEVIRNVLDE